ncbi:hypothetical protein M422DRAFT_51160 [Sphaerobolus stellatus SS14]|uniref:Uncharacterized protein n=1 Tax=Sphaerobolus stellatus (strain SS14) TaxID=990650 RepID=A0A0C9VFQ5_SPHS4|nr:hypothetical protein M422DRAFT_51160 [Sphaerobolus stellatus SS14]
MAEFDSTSEAPSPKNSFKKRMGSYYPTDLWVSRVLKQRNLDDREIWDTIFGLQVGVVDDIEAAIDTGGFAKLLFDTILKIFNGSLKISQDLSDMPGKLSHTAGISYTNYSIMAAKLWRDTQLIVVKCQAGVTVVPDHPGEGNCRLHKLPIEFKKGVHVVMVVYGSTRYHSSGIGVLVQKVHTGLGSWQMTKFGRWYDISNILHIFDQRSRMAYLL